MCGTCGCNDSNNKVTMTKAGSEQAEIIRAGSIFEQEHAHDHHHHHHDDHHHHDHHHHHDENTPHVHGENGEIISLEMAVLSKNNQIAGQNRGWFAGRGVLALNLVSSPGSGKTSLLEETVKLLAKEQHITVIEGDQMTVNDAERIRKAGAEAVQINTGAGCHLEADMIARAVESLNPPSGSILFIENVGNLVCPAMFDLGEHMKVAVISTPEGEDKPLKYPHMFQAAQCVIVNKIDLAPHLDFNETQCRDNILEINPQAHIISLSAKTGEGMAEWTDFISHTAAKYFPA